MFQNAAVEQPSRWEAAFAEMQRARETHTEPNPAFLRDLTKSAGGNLFRCWHGSLQLNTLVIYDSFSHLLTDLLESLILPAFSMAQSSMN